MTKEQVVTTTCYGLYKPRIHQTITAAGTHEQWVYEGGNHLYFENGILTAIQMPR